MQSSELRNLLRRTTRERCLVARHAVHLLWARHEHSLLLREGCVAPEVRVAPRLWLLSWLIIILQPVPDRVRSRDAEARFEESIFLAVLERQWREIALLANVGFERLCVPSLAVMATVAWCVRVRRAHCPFLGPVALGPCH